MSTVTGPLNATFFALKPRDRAVLLPATLVLVAITAVLIGIFVALNWSTLTQLYHGWQIAVSNVGDKQQTMGQDESMRLLGGMFALMSSVFLLLIPFYIALAAYEAACLRWMIRGETPGFFGFALDHDTWRVYGIYWCWLIGQYVVSLAMSVVTLPIAFMMMGDITRMTDPNEMWRWQMGVQLPLTLLQYVPLIFLGVRFAPAAATSVARKRFSLFEAWKVTKERFWSLLGSFALLWLIFAVAMIIAAALTIGPMILPWWQEMVAHWPSIDSAGTQAMVLQLFSPEGLRLIALSYALNAALLLFYVPMSYGVNARAAMAALEEGKISVSPAT